MDTMRGLALLYSLVMFRILLAPSAWTVWLVWSGGEEEKKKVEKVILPVPPDCSFSLGDISTHLIPILVCLSPVLNHLNVEKCVSRWTSETSSIGTTLTSMARSPTAGWVGPDR
ncbi:hypothetical protein LZ30DRAFT_690719 [Colletotrichum cereale]|nr:hypothetical protein LZ30DRAFT_690719 [Colletotrichum cereale]